MHRAARSRRIVTIVILVAYACLASAMVCATQNTKCLASTKDGVVELYVFNSADCEHCRFLESELLPMLQQRFGPKIDFSYYSMTEGPSGFRALQFMLNLEDSFGRNEMAFPQVYIGNHALIGPEEIRNNLPERVAEYAAKGGVDLPSLSTGGEVVEPPPTTPMLAPEKTNPSNGQPTTIEFPVYIAYFYESGCRRCDAISMELDFMQAYGSGITVRKYDISKESDLKMNEAMCTLYSVPEDRRGVAPAVFVGPDYLSGGELNRKSLTAAVKNRQKTGTLKPWEEAKDNLDIVAGKRIEDRFKRFGIFAVLGAGLVDGVNPCAFTVMVFLVAYLAFTDRRGKEMLYVGGAFSLTVFLTYLLIGVGLFSFVRAIGGTGTAGKWISIAVASFTAAFGLLALLDYARSRRSGKPDSTMGISPGVTRRIHKAIRKNIDTGYLVVGTVVLGVVITVLELGCTGQIYLPTITFVARSGDDRFRAILYLVLYCLMFVLPLVVVFLLSYFGTSQKKMVDFGRRNANVLKLAGGLMLIGLSVLLFATI